MNATTKDLIVLLLGLSVSAALAAASSSGEPVICVSGDSALERHAAEEFSRYAAEITDRKLEMSSAASAGDGTVIFSVGQNALTEALSLGLCSIPFWWIMAFTTHQWLTVPVHLLYTYGWLRKAYVLWGRRRTDG